MSDAILLLRLEHGNMSRLLDWVEDQVRLLETGAAVNHGLLSQAMYYLQNYPDQCHHPKEDLVLEIMARRDPEAAAAFSDLTMEHKKITNLTMRAAAALNRAGTDAAADLELREALRELTEQYRRHMEMEETVFFPRALEVLNHSDWASVDFELFDRDDPLFDHSQEQRFQILRESVSRFTRHHLEMTIARREIELLENFNGIEDFNQSMEQQGSQLRLVRLSETGFGLERQGKMLAYIPSLEEAQAIWCAYYYAKGAEDISLS